MIASITPTVTSLANCNSCTNERPLDYLKLAWKRLNQLNPIEKNFSLYRLGFVTHRPCRQPIGLAGSSGSVGSRLALPRIPRKPNPSEFLNNDGQNKILKNGHLPGDTQTSGQHSETQFSQDLRFPDRNQRLLSATHRLQRCF